VSGGSTPILNWGLNVEASHGDMRVATNNLGGQSYGLDTLPDIKLDGWHHLALTWTSNGNTAIANAYLDGGIISSTTVATDDGSGIDLAKVYQTSGIFNIGDDICCANREFDGLIDDLAVWNRELPSEHIADIYSNGRFGIGVGDVPNTGALYLDGVDDWMEFTNTAGLIPDGNEPFTIEAWINTSATNNGTITFWGGQSNNKANGFRLNGANGRHYFWSNDFDQIFGLNTLIDNDEGGRNIDGWHHLAITYNQTESTWYLDGTNIGTQTRNSGVNVSNANHRIGSALGDDFFHGFIDEVRIWNYARTPSQIENSFGFTSTGSEPGLVAYWPFNSNLQDATGNGSNGTAMGGAIISSAYNAPVITAHPIAVTEFSIANGTLTIEWNSLPNKTYELEGSEDLEFWIGVELDAQPGLRTSVGAAFEPIGSGYFRVRQINPFWR
jgi:hypothetical protein